MHKYEILEAGKPLYAADRAILAIHGRGSSATNILSLAQELAGEDYYLVAPQATNNTWYPYSFLASVNENQPWLNSAVDIINQIISNLKETLPGNKIYVLGFSQGACLALEATARNASLFGGVIAFTGGLIGETLDTNRYSGDFGGSNIYLSNSFNDPHVPLQRSRESVDELEKRNAQVILDLYEDRPHTILQDEIDKVKDMFFY